MTTVRSLGRHEFELGDVPLHRYLSGRPIPPRVADLAGLRDLHDDLHRIWHWAIAGLERPWLGLAQDCDSVTVGVPGLVSKSSTIPMTRQPTQEWTPAAEPNSGIQNQPPRYRHIQHGVASGSYSMGVLRGMEYRHGGCECP